MKSARVPAVLHGIIAPHQARKYSIRQIPQKGTGIAAIAARK
jgi:hypothetical protein